MSEYWQVSTEGDCEGRSTRVIGVFKGDKWQVAQYLLDNNIRPEYSFYFKRVERPVVDVTGIKPYDDLYVVIGKFGKVEITAPEETLRKAREKSLKISALNKLTDEERKALGL